MNYYEFHVARRYVQFAGALRELPRYLAAFGKKALIVTSCGPIREQVADEIRAGFSLPLSENMQQDLLQKSPRYASWNDALQRLEENRRSMDYTFYDVGDIPLCRENVYKAAQFAERMGADIIVGVGGGRCLDLAKAVTRYWPAKVALVPTLAATNASSSPLSVWYDETGSRIVEYWRMDNSPELVLADTRILVNNGAQVLAAGMGDLASTYCEARCNLKLTGHEQYSPALSYRGIDLAYSILLEQAPRAAWSARTGEITPEFESVLSMILHNCGPLWMICTTGYAHVVDEIFLQFDASHRVMHGLRVGLATLAMFSFQGAAKSETDAYRKFCGIVGIPTSLADIGLDSIAKTQWLEAAHRCGERLRALPFSVSEQDIVESILGIST